MPFIPDERAPKKAEVETLFPWAMKDGSVRGSLVVCGDGSIGVEWGDSAGKAAVISPTDARKLAIAVIERTGGLR